MFLAKVRAKQQELQGNLSRVKDMFKNTKYPVMHRIDLFLVWYQEGYLMWEDRKPFVPKSQIHNLLKSKFDKYGCIKPEHFSAAECRTILATMEKL